MKTLVVYAWCFSHGTLHHFKPRETPWCTATWVHLDAYSEDTALAIKQRAWGNARFLHELSPDQQAAIIGLAEGREPRVDAGPTVREAAADDRAHWNTKYAGEGP